MDIRKEYFTSKVIRWLIRFIVLILVVGSISIIPTEYSSKDTQEEIVFSEEILNEYREAKELVFLNFTADWCITCKVNERVALSSKKVTELMIKRNIIYLEADWTRKDGVIAKKLEQFGRTGVPLYLLYPSEGEPIILPEILTEDILLRYLNELS